MSGHSALPIYCRYGKACKAPDCIFTHAESVQKVRYAIPHFDVTLNF